MKHFTKKFGLLVTMLLTALQLYAYDACIDGIYYNLDSTTKTATVTCNFIST